MENISVTTLLTTFWPQLTLLFAIISYFFNRSFNFKDKKVELRNTLFEQERMKAIDLFISKYIQIEFVFTQLNYHDAITSKISAKELDNIVFPSYNDFLSSYYKLFFLLSDDELTDFNTIYNSISHVKGTLGDMRFTYGGEKDDLFKKTETYIGTAFDAARQNKTVLKDIGRKFRRAYLK